MGRPGEMKEAIRILDEWVHQQPHFIEKDIPQPYLETTIVNSKGSVERAKRILENMFTARTQRPEYFEPRDVREFYDVIKGHINKVFTTQLTPQQHRININRCRGRPDDHVLENAYKFAYNVMDYLKIHDYHSGMVSVFDLVDADLPYILTHTNFVALKNAMMIFLDCYGLRVKRIHVITRSKVIHQVVAILKPFFSQKIVERLVFHQAPEELLQYYAAEYLPKEYGGSDKSVEELQEWIVDLLSSPQHRAHMEVMSRAAVDAVLCPATHAANIDHVAGTFRTLHID
ncbi:alpha-tocopherol transfer protein-like [Aricia agestis]|uniref:alpha-tocopherol transfer protein-like n=1 Tax=Aricia agestis TaxID=91739 RepID=UPI001C207470|nr:alpha-tocopherol transfer protein-like [Aricia agestis]